MEAHTPVIPRNMESFSPADESRPVRRLPRIPRVVRLFDGS